MTIFLQTVTWGTELYLFTVDYSVKSWELFILKDYELTV